MSDDIYSQMREQNHRQAHFLEQLSEQEFWQYAQDLAHTEILPLLNSEEYLECETMNDRYLISLRALHEIVPPPHKLTFLPLCPSWMLGITAWRGHIIPVVDLAAYFFVQLPQNDTSQAPIPSVYPHSNSFLLILDGGHCFLGLQVPIVKSIITLEQAHLTTLDQPPSWYPQQLQAAVLGLYQQSVVINPQTFLSDVIQHVKVTAAYE
jgi:chemotaxis signal transduction protein